MARRDAERLTVEPVLDPRTNPSPTIRGGVNIPFAELPKRLHELPSKSQTVLIADVDEASETAGWLRIGGRRVEIVQREYGEPGKRLWCPTAFLESVLRNLAPGDALDLGCGTGRDAVAMASHGWRVTAVDVLPDAIERGRDLERRYGPKSAPPIRWMAADVDSAHLPDEAFDLVTMFRFLHRPSLTKAQAWLRPGGDLLVETFTTTHRGRYGRPSAQHCLAPGELAALVPELDIVELDEQWRGEVHTLRAWARRP